MKIKSKNSVRECLIKYAPCLFNTSPQSDEDNFISMLQEKVEEQWPTRKTEYWYITTAEEPFVSHSSFVNDNVDKFHIAMGNAFKSEQEAEARLKEVMEGK